MRHTNTSQNCTEAGFSYIDVMISLVILTVGILALLSGIAGSVILSKGQQQQLTARHIAATTMESIMSAKETKDPDRLGWNSIGNIGSNVVEGVPKGIFVVGVKPVMSGAGADEIFGTVDDSGTATSGFNRQIVITDQCDPDRPSPICPNPGTWPIRLRTVSVTITYSVGSVQRQEKLTTVLADYEPVAQ